MDGQSNDVYAEMERSVSARLKDGMALLYSTVPIYSPLSKDPETAAEVYAVLPESEAVRRGLQDRRLLEDALIEIGFPLEEITGFDAEKRRLVPIRGTPSTAPSTIKATEDVGAVAETPWPSGGAQAILEALQGPLPYIRRGAWGKK